eukprot:2109841-Pyramimonas_sp.AAC.1
MAQSVLELLQGDSEEFQAKVAISAWALLPLRAGSLLLALVVVASYTANLAAFFTKPSFTIHGPSNMERLLSATVCTTMYDEWTVYSEADGQNVTSGSSVLRDFVGELYDAG